MRDTAEQNRAGHAPEIALAGRQGPLRIRQGFASSCLSAGRGLPGVAREIATNHRTARHVGSRRSVLETCGSPLPAGRRHASKHRSASDGMKGGEIARPRLRRHERRPVVPQMRGIAWARCHKKGGEVASLRAVSPLYGGADINAPSYPHLRRRRPGHPTGISTIGTRDGSSKPGFTRNTRNLKNNQGSQMPCPRNTRDLKNTLDPPQSSERNTRNPKKGVLTLFRTCQPRPRGRGSS